MQSLQSTRIRQQRQSVPDSERARGERERDRVGYPQLQLQPQPQPWRASTEQSLGCRRVKVEKHPWHLDLHLVKLTLLLLLPPWQLSPVSPLPLSATHNNGNIVKRQHYHQQHVAATVATTMRTDSISRRALPLLLPFPLSSVLCTPPYLFPSPSFSCYATLLATTLGALV